MLCVCDYRSVPLLLREHAQHPVRHDAAVGFDVSLGICRRVLEPVEHRQQLALDEVDEHEVDRGIACHVRCGRPDEVWRGVERKRGVERVVANARA